MKSRFLCFTVLCLIFVMTSFVVYADSYDDNSEYEEYLAKLENSKFEEKGIYYPITEKYRNGEYGEEVYCLGITSAWSGSDGIIVIYQKEDKKQMIVYGRYGRFSKRNLSDDEYNKLISFINNNNVANLPDFDTGMVMDGVWYDYFHITDKGREYAYMNNPEVYSDTDYKIYNDLVQEFKSLQSYGNFEIGYDISDVGLVVKNKDYIVCAVWKEKDDFRILVYDEEKSTQFKPEYKWISISDNSFGTTVSKPGIFKTALESSPDEFQAHFNNATSEKWNGYAVCSFNNKLHLMSGKVITSIISENAYNSPVVVPGTDYVVCEKNVNGWENPTQAVKIDLVTFEETYLNLPKHLNITPLAVLNGKVLFSASDEHFYEYDKNIKYYLYDIQNDTYELAEGDFSCYLSQYINTRPLQPSSEDGKYYAIADQHTVGIFDTLTHKFTALFTSPVPIENNDHMWIDEDEGVIYIVVNHELLAFPISIPGKEKSISVVVDGKEVFFDVEPKIENGRTLVPMRFIFEALGAEVSWNDETFTATAVKDNINLQIQIDNNIMYKNEESVKLDVCAKLEQSRTLVPVRAIAEGFGAVVEWNALKRQITINS